MFPDRRVAVFVVLSIAGVTPSSLVSSGGMSPRLPLYAADTFDRSSEPVFKREAAAKGFAAGVKHFKRGAYQKARANFKKARMAAKGRNDKVLVDNWIKAANGGAELVRFKKLAKRGRYRQAYEHLTKAYGTYRGTPIDEQFMALWKDLGNRVSTVIEGFDSHSGYYARKPSRSFVKDAEQVLHGSQCLRWTSVPDKKSVILKLRRVPEDWSPYDTVELCYNAASAPREIEFVIACGTDGRGKTGAVRTYSSKRRLSGKGWQCMHLPLKKFTKSGSPSLSKVESVEIVIDDDRKFDLMLDRVSLLRVPERIARRR